MFCTRLGKRERESDRERERERERGREIKRERERERARGREDRFFEAARAANPHLTPINPSTRRERRAQVPTEVRTACLRSG